MFLPEIAKCGNFSQIPEEHSLYQLLVRAYSSRFEGNHIPAIREDVRPRTFIIYNYSRIGEQFGY